MRWIVLIFAGFCLLGCTPEDLTPVQRNTICNALVGPIRYNTYDPKSGRYSGHVLALDLEGQESDRGSPPVSPLCKEVPSWLRTGLKAPSNILARYIGHWVFRKGRRSRPASWLPPSIQAIRRRAAAPIWRRRLRACIELAKTKLTSAFHSLQSALPGPSDPAALSIVIRTR